MPLLLKQLHSRWMSHFGWRAFALLVLPFVAVGVSADPAPVLLQDATATEAGRALQRLVGAPVEVRGGEGRKVTLNLSANTPPSRALDRVVLQLGGTWRMKLQVRAGKAAQPRNSPLIEKNVAFGIQDVSAARAFTLVARDLNAELELEGDLEAKISVIVVNVAASVLLDRIAEQAGASWDISYVIDAPNLPQPILVLPSKREPAPIPMPDPPNPEPEPTASVPRPASAADLRAELRAGIHQIVRAEPGKRAEVVRDFLQRGETLLALLGTLSPAERAERLRALATVVTPWRRLYQGLAPEVHRELAPVTALLSRLLP